MKNHPTQPLEHIIWDWNGTLLDDVAACVEAINQMILARGLEILEQDRYRDIFRFPVKSYYAELGFDLKTEDWDGMAREFHRHYYRTSQTAMLRPGVVDILKNMQSRGVPMSILSACEITILRRMLDERGIADFFEHVYGLDNLHARSKLDQGHSLMAEIGIDPDRILLIGDTLHDDEVAQALGCRCLLLRGGHQSDRQLQKSSRQVVTLDAIWDA
jgi:phosphoglycolate phosphatase